MPLRGSMFMSMNGDWHLCKCPCVMRQLDSSIFNETNRKASHEITVLLLFN